MIRGRTSIPAVSVAPSTFFADVRARLESGARLLTFYGTPAGASDHVALTAIFLGADGAAVTRTSLERGGGFHSLTRDFPALHVFEREVHEECGVTPRDHPWLKPVRFSGERAGRTADYPFYRVDGKEVHEVGVGPIHAGVIEPGHFRFMCLGERVHHLEIQLGYQHRGVSGLLLRRPPASLGPLVETVSGDSSVAHAFAYTSALEALTELKPTDATATARAIGLELERVAMHLSSLSGMCADIALLQGAATYGRLRTTVINTTMAMCGSRFGRGWMRPHRAGARLDDAARATARENLALVRRDIALVNELVLSSRVVAHRLRSVGTVSGELAARLGFVGLTARASGVAVDLRHEPTHGEPDPGDPRAAPERVVESAGDCHARLVVRIREIDASLAWLARALSEPSEPTAEAPAGIPPLPPDTLGFAAVEGFRGEIVHVLESGADGRLTHYRVQDPSLRNWYALAMAVRDNDISDFPICNKSFDLSYCGNDL